MDIDSLQLVAEIKSKARALKFDLVGIAPASPSMYGDYFRDWLAAGRAGTMDYLHARADERVDPNAYFPGAKSVICVAINYYAPLEPAAAAGDVPRGRIARYALGDDYHSFLKQQLYDLADWLRDRVPGAQTRCGVDTVPVMEKELAARAGLGWVGKHTCVINEQLGSWLLLGEVLTTLDLPADGPADDHCGSCTRCLDACPTGAIVAPYQLDASKCISYLTIEHRGEIAPELAGRTGGWVFGCDVCQDVCPHNRRPTPTGEERFTPRFPTGTVDLDAVVRWTEEEYRATFKKTAVKRIKLPVFQRNAVAARGNGAGAEDMVTEVAMPQ